MIFDKPADFYHLKVTGLYKKFFIFYDFDHAIEIMNKKTN